MAKASLKDKILDTAIEIAEASSWEDVRLAQIADQLDISLSEIAQYYREKQELINAWFDRANQAMLEHAKDPYLIELNTKERLHRLITSWLDALANHRRVTREMICARLEPGHLPIQAIALVRLSRTIQWLREAARCEATYLHRFIEEIVLTGVFMATFSYWLFDHSHESQRTKTLLRRKLHFLERVANKVKCHVCEVTTEAVKPISTRM